MTNKNKAREREFENLSGGFVRFEEAGDSAEGAYRGLTFQNGENGVYPKYHLLGDDGEMVSFNGTVQLIECLSRLPIGVYVRVTYTGESEKVAKGRVKIFEIEVEKGVDLLPPKLPLQFPPDTEAHWDALLSASE